MTIIPLVLRLAAAAVLALFGAVTLAAPDEIQVYTEELDDPGTFGIEMHVNFVPKGEKAPAWRGATPSNHVLQVTPEFSYGLTRTLEAGLYLPLALAPGGHAVNNGARLRLKYIAPRADGDRFFWGLNWEFGYSSRRVSDSAWGVELRPIVGWRDGGWRVAFNPILGIDLTAEGSRIPRFEPALKLTREVRGGLAAGVELYGDLGPIHHRRPGDERSHFVVGVVDVEMKGFDVNFGIGRGYGDTGDTWVVKAIVALPF